MVTDSVERRSVLAGAAATLALGAAGAQAAAKAETEPNAMPWQPAGAVTGKGVGDFDFLAGEWSIAHRRLKDGTADSWDEFTSRATVHRVLDGMASIEELRKPDGRCMGMGVRVWHPDQALWADHWTSAANGVVNEPQMGRFIAGEGVFVSAEEKDGVRWLYRGVWDRITATSCRWHQSSSPDGGKSWSWNWTMDWTRQS